MNVATCLAQTGIPFVGLILAAAVLLGVGTLLLRNAKSRRTVVMLLLLVGLGGSVLLGSHSSGAATTVTTEACTTTTSTTASSTTSTLAPTSTTLAPTTTTTTTPIGTLHVVYVGHVTNGGTPVVPGGGNTLMAQVCTDAASTHCATFNQDVASVPSNEDVTFLGSSTTVYITTVASACGVQLWSAAPTGTQIRQLIWSGVENNASPTAGGPYIGWGYATPMASPESAASFTSGQTVYLATDADDCY